MFQEISIKRESSTLLKFQTNNYYMHLLFAGVCILSFFFHFCIKKLFQMIVHLIIEIDFKCRRNDNHEIKYNHEIK